MNKFNTAHRRRLSSEERFLSFVEPEPTSGCWLWAGNGGRYGQFWLNRHNLGAHVASWLLFRGEKPPHLQVLHKCDVSLCVNPDHLFVGSQLDNRRDAMTKNRVARGERIHNAVLAEAKVRTIRDLYAAGETCQAIARHLMLNRVTVSAVVNRRNWRHL